MTDPLAEPDLIDFGAPPSDIKALLQLYTLKALAFIHLRQGQPEQTREMIAALRVPDPAGAVGWPVIEALAAGIA